MQPVSESPRLLVVFKAVCTLILQLTWRVSERRADDSTHSISLLKGRGMWLQACTHFPTPGETGHYLHCHCEAMKTTQAHTHPNHTEIQFHYAEKLIFLLQKSKECYFLTVLGPQPEYFFYFFQKTRYFPFELSEFSQAGVSWPDLNPPRNSRISN